MTKIITIFLIGITSYLACGTASGVTDTLTTAEIAPVALTIEALKPDANTTEARFSIALINTTGEDVILSIVQNNPLFTIGVGKKREAGTPPRLLIEPSLVHHGAMLVDLSLQPHEKKIYFMSLRRDEATEVKDKEIKLGTYTVAAYLPVVRYMRGTRKIEARDVDSVIYSTIEMNIGSGNTDAAKVRAIVQTVPDSVDWVLGSAPEPKKIRIELLEPANFKLLSVKSSNDQFSATLSEIIAGKIYDVTITPKLTSILVKTNLSFETNSIVLPEINISVVANKMENDTIDATKPNSQQETAQLPRAEDDPQNKIATAQATVKVGQVAPDFDVKDADGKSWKLSTLKGEKAVVLTFFPKCFTGGCANHLSSLRDHQAEFDKNDVQIIAVSVDPADGEKGQKAFAQQWKLLFPLIPDTQRVLSKLYGAVQQNDERAARMTFLIDKAGIVRFVDTDVHVQTHGADVLAKLRALGIIQKPAQ